MNKQYPLMYKGYLITKQLNKLGGHSMSTGHQINHLFNGWPNLKLILDNIK